MPLPYPITYQPIPMIGIKSLAISGVITIIAVVVAVVLVIPNLPKKK